MKNYIFSIIICLFVLSGCKKNPLHKTTPKEYISIKNGINDFDSLLKERDSIVFEFNLTMENYVRIDTLILKKSKDLYATTIVSFLDFENKIQEQEKFKSLYIPKEQLYCLEAFYNENIHRIKDKGLPYILKSSFKNENIILFGGNLSDRARFLRDYFTVMEKVHDIKFNYLD